MLNGMVATFPWRVSQWCAQDDDGRAGSIAFAAANCGASPLTAVTPTKAWVTAISRSDYVYVCLSFSPGLLPQRRAARRAEIYVLTDKCVKCWQAPTGISYLRLFR